MDATLLLSQFNGHQRIGGLHHSPASFARLQRSHSVAGSYQPMLTSTQSSFVRSSAPRSMIQQQQQQQQQHAAPQHYVPYTAAAAAAAAFQQGEAPNRSDSVSSGGTDVSQSSDRQEYDVPVVPTQQYAAEYLANQARGLSAAWPNVEFSFQGSGMIQHYVPSQKDDSFGPHIADFGSSSLPPFYDHHTNSGGSEVSLGSYGGMSGHGASNHNYTISSNHLTSTVDPPSVAYGFSGQVNAPAQHMTVQHSLQEPSYTLASPHQLDYPSPGSLHYPSSSPEGSPARFVNLAQVSPSPTISPGLIFTDLPVAPGSPGSQSIDPRNTANSSNDGSGRNSPASVIGYEPDGFTQTTSRGRRGARQGGEPANKRQRRTSVTSSSDGSTELAEGESGESEREEDDDVDGDFEDGGDDDDDDDYVLRASSRQRVRRRSSRNGTGAQEGGLSASATFSPALAGGTRRLAPPVPVPNLTKKSRGRRVPTAPVMVSQNGVTKNTRTYMCRVNGCNKCFARGEHLKRHVRSIHTNEKPHKCPFPGCGKDFSRHDNLGQHMRVHKNYKPPVDNN